MKKLLLLFTLIPCLAFGQTTAIPDANFEQALIDLGFDTGTPDGSVPTANIDTVTFLDVNFKSISDLTGIEDFAALTYLDCGANQLTSLDVSNNTALTWLSCGGSKLTSQQTAYIVVDGQHHHSRNKQQPQLQPPGLNPFRNRPSDHRFYRVIQKVSPIEHGDWQQIEYAQ